MSDSNVEAVIHNYKIREAKGLTKYGITTDREDVDILGWLTHAQEEAMDLTIYLERLKKEVSKMQVKDKPLHTLTEKEYNTLKDMGFLWEFYPEATGSWFADTGSDWVSKYE